MQAATPRDGQHDFDFEIGTWKVHLKKLQHPLTGSTTWIEFDGTIAARAVWDGRANFDEFQADSPSGHIEGLTLRLYNPQSRQWNLYWANPKDGTFSGPPQVGEFKNGIGEFYCQDTYNGRTILIRYVWSAITPNSAHFEQSFSTDGGKTWEVNWITDQTRTGAESAKASAAAQTDSAAAPPASADQDGQHGFDGLLGTWNYHVKRLMHPLTGSTTWNQFPATGTCHRIWGGRAQVDTFEADDPTGHIEGLVVRLYNPQNHQWSLNWATSKTGIPDPPQIGKFKNGHGDFYTQDTINGKTIFVRYDWSKINTDTPHFEQSFSDDGGTTWEVNWITDQTRASDAPAKAQ
ncbi:MAG: hypothetical protein WCF88_12585 [Candidatus Acidiferrales bacterium]|jgi:hypothetical protein